jgi:hypothetical protein
VHWIARSAFLLSLVSGCLAVYYASLLQRKLGNFRTPEQVREWWRCSRSIEREAHLATPALRPTHLEDANSETQVDFERTLLAIVQSWGDKEGPKLQASVAAAILMSSPSMMINFALGAFLTGIGVYLGFVWQNDLDTIAGKSESRNVFICFLTSLVFCYTFYILPSLSKLWEDNKKPTRKTRQLEERIERTFPAVRRIWALSRLERLQPEMMSNLLPDLKKLATGARSSDWDDRWIVEAIETMKSFDTILDGWDFAKLEALMVEVKEKEQKEKRKRMMRVLMERFVVRTNWRESHKTFGESTALNETKNKTEDEQGNEVDDKTNKTKDIDLESGILGGQST